MCPINTGNKGRVIPGAWSPIRPLSGRERASTFGLDADSVIHGRSDALLAA
jgi:hypothetical protein